MMERPCSPHVAVPRVHRLLVRALLALALCACDGDAARTTAAIAPLEIDRATTCELDGMLLADYPGPKAQIFYQGQAAPEFFCDTVELFSTLLKPEQVRAVRAAYVQDMGRADWGHPEGHWIDVKAGWYVVGSQRKGSMGTTIASFAEEGPARQFVAQYGGKLLRQADITPDMVDLGGGAVHDSRM